MEIEYTVYEQIVVEAHKEYPLECCGYLAGVERRVSRAYPMKNIDKSKIHYSFDPEEQFKTVKEIRRQNLQILAVYHSHPETPARPSEEDIRLAYDPDVSYVIISLCEGKDDVRSYIIKERQVEPEELTIR
ncbi:MAG: M67 family metallopeptidase [Desulfobulbaceae bacterium]|nr:M67 family metallopeptidase [Desulfobulbaceae bacterium]